MAEISAGLVKELREMTGLGMMECKKALTECAGDLKKAEELLRIKSGAKASKAAGRIAAEGVIGAWLAADGKVGALVELNSETDFVAKNEDFLAFAKPAYLARSDVPQDVIADERRIQEARAKESGKSAEIVAKMVEGAVHKFVGEKTLLGQPFVKDDKQTVEKMLAARKAKVNGYAFFVVGEGIEKKSTDFAAEVMAQAGRAH